MSFFSGKEIQNTSSLEKGITALTNQQVSKLRKEFVSSPHDLKSGSSEEKNIIAKSQILSQLKDASGLKAQKNPPSHANVKKAVTTDRQLLREILAGTTKSPITRDRWLEFVAGAYSKENTVAFVELSTYFEVYHKLCNSISLNSNISEPIVTLLPVAGMISFENSVNSENELKKWSEDICNLLITKYLKKGAEIQLNLSDKESSECLKLCGSGKYHPNIFKDILESILLMMVENDLPKFKSYALDENMKAKHRLIRLISGLVIAFGATVLYGFLLEYKLSQYYRFLGFPLLVTMFLSYFQWKAKFCVVFSKLKVQNTGGYVGVSNIEDDYACAYQGKRAETIYKKSLASAAILFVILFVVPPYNW